MSAAPPVSDGDRALGLAYLDGSLPTAEEKAFELRLGREPALARAFEELASTHDALAATLGTGSAAPARGTRARRVWPWVAAAASVAALVLARSLAGPPEAAPAAFVAAAVATAPSDAGFNELLGFDPDWLPAGMGYRSEPGAAVPEADAYASALAAAFDARVADVLEDAGSEARARARSFVVAFQPERDGHLLAVALGADGRVEPLTTAPEGELVSGGTLHLLPRAPVELPADWRESQRVDYAPGVLTRRGMHALLALRAGAPDAELVAAWTERVAQYARSALEPGAGARQLAEWLGERGFTTRVVPIAPPE